MILNGPLGPFEVPDSPENTRDHVIDLSVAVWAGEYDHPELPTSGIGRVLDIGACCGAFAVWAVEKWGRDLKVDCYEPNAAALPYLRRNVATDFGMARIHEVAVTTLAHPTLCLCDKWAWGSASVYRQTEGTPVMPLHPRDLPPADVVKCDAEGVEPEVLAEYRHWDGVQVLLYEFHHADHRVICRELAERAGFRCLREETEPATYGPTVWVRA